MDNQGDVLDTKLARLAVNNIVHVKQVNKDDEEEVDDND